MKVVTVYDVACPFSTCRAGVGETCRTEFGNQRVVPHVARVDEFLREKRQQQQLEEAR